MATLRASTLAPLQRVMKAAARLVYNLSPRDHITSALHSLYSSSLAKFGFRSSGELIKNFASSYILPSMNKQQSTSGSSSQQLLSIPWQIFESFCLQK
jgi:hypothetical protein